MPRQRAQLAQSRSGARYRSATAAHEGSPHFRPRVHPESPLQSRQDTVHTPHTDRSSYIRSPTRPRAAPVPTPPFPLDVTMLGRPVSANVTGIARAAWKAAVKTAFDAK